MNRFTATASALLLAATATVSAQIGVPEWQLATEQLDDRVVSLERIVSGAPLAVRQTGDPVQRPRLTVALDPGGIVRTQGEADGPSISWSLEAWEMNTASLAHIQCSRAVRSIERFLVEDCRFVEGPLPQASTNLVQLSGQWMASPSLALGAGIYTGHQPGADALPPLMSARTSTGLPGRRERIDGLNLNLSFGMDLGSIGDLLFDLQVDRYRQRPESASTWYAAGTEVPGSGVSPWWPSTAVQGNIDSRVSGELGIGWRGRSFGADLTGQYRELPYWFGEELQGEGFRSFDIEFSWRAPTRASFSVGICPDRRLQVPSRAWRPQWMVSMGAFLTSDTSMTCKLVRF
jgi:hypothetical protein